jgi:hypothetical protein
MALPKKVQEQLDRAESTLAQMNAPAPAAPDVPAEPAPVEAASTTPQAAPAPEPAPEQPATNAQPQPSADLEHKYRTLQGIHRYLEEQNRTKEQQIAQMRAELDALKADPPARPEVSVDPNDAAVFGDDMVDMVKRVAEAMFGASAKKFDERLAAIEQRLEGTSAAVSKTAEEIFLERLRAAVPDYEAINVDQGFLAWLGEVDPVYGMPRQNALTAAANALDVARVSNVFKAYKAMIAPAPETPKPRAAAKSLESQTAPSTAAPAAAREATVPVYTTAQVTQFYRDLQSGKYRGREAEANQIEADLNLALAEGRIVDRPTRSSIV